MEAKEAAKILFDQGATNKEIANILKKSEHTIGAWVKKGNWEKKRAEYALHRETAEEQVWGLINYQLKIIGKIRERHEIDLDKDLSVAELQKLLISKGDIDALQKLFTTIKGKELEWTQVVKVIRDFTEFIERVNLPMAQQIIILAQDFINERRKEL